MSCRNTHAGRAMTRIARQTSGLLDVQVTHLVHAARREFRRTHGTPQPATRQERQALIGFLRQHQNAVTDNGGNMYSVASQRKLLGNLRQAISDAESSELTNADVYVWTHVEADSVRANNAVNLFLRAQAEAHGENVDDWNTVYHEAMDTLERPGRGRPAEEEEIPLDEFGDYAPIVDQTPGDFRTRTVLHRLTSHGVQRCPACGQYLAVAGNSHDCPTPTPVPDLPPVAPTLTTPQPEDPSNALGENAVAETEPTPTATGATTSAEPSRPSRINTRIYHNDDRTLTFTMPSVGGLKLALTDQGATRNVDVNGETATGNTLTGTALLRNEYTPAQRGGVERVGYDGRWRQHITVIDHDLRCDCADYRARYDCEHVRATVNEIHTALNGASARPATPPAAAVAEARSLIEEDYAASQAALGFVTPDPQLSVETPDSGVQFLSSPAEFITAAEQAHEQRRNGDYALPYYTENVLGESSAPGGPRTFGLELEIDFPDEDLDSIGESKARLAEALAEAGLSQYSTALPWHYVGRDRDARDRPMGGDFSDDPSTWSVEFDRSVDDYNGRRGCEVKSPIMSDTPRAWQDIHTVCTLIRQLGGQVTLRTGMHVNIGTSDLNHTIGHYNRIAQISSVYDDVLVRMSTSPEKGTDAHRGRAYCEQVIAPAEGFRSIRELQTAQGDDSDERHRRSVNFSHVPRERQPVQIGTRVEMRLFDGTFDPGRIQAAIRLSAGIVDAAAAGRGPGMDPEPGGTHHSRLRYNGPASIEEDSISARRLIDLVGGSLEGKQQLAHMWGQNPWPVR